jgi:hypothetical protein
MRDRAQGTHGAGQLISPGRGIAIVSADCDLEGSETPLVRGYACVLRLGGW